MGLAALHRPTGFLAYRQAGVSKGLYKVILVLFFLLLIRLFCFLFVLVLFDFFSFHKNSWLILVYGKHCCCNFFTPLLISF